MSPMGSPRRWLSHAPWPDVQAFERRCKAAREREAAAEPRTGPWILGALDEARALARRAESLHREADESPEAERRASLRRAALVLEQQADRVVPVEYR